MTLAANDLLQVAERQHRHLLRRHWNGQSLVGPDPGIRFNARIGRFLKSYLDFLPWSDDLIYMQAQGYWILDNWLMRDLLGEAQYERLALACSEYVLAAQCPGGYWDYPNPEWRGRIATVEGCFAALGLLESYARSGHAPFLGGARQWYRYLVDGIGFRRQPQDGMLAVNYFAHNSGGFGGGVPNNSTLALWTLAKLAKVTADDQYLTMAPGMVAWLNHVQLPSGELPYAVGGPGRPDRPHFLCYQYNAFEFLDLVHYYRLTQDRGAWRMMERLARYLATALTPRGAARYDCTHELPEIPYYTAALGAALSRATALGLGDFRSEGECAYRRVLSQLGPDGPPRSFSRGDHGWLADRRSYPRSLSMILHHLLLEAQMRAPMTEQAPLALRSS